MWPYWGRNISAVISIELESKIAAIRVTGRIKESKVVKKLSKSLLNLKNDKKLYIYLASLIDGKVSKMCTK